MSRIAYTGFVAGFVCVSIQTPAVSQPDLPADRLTQAQAASGEYISWREHLIDDPEIAGIPLSGSDGLSMADLDGDGFEDIVSVHEADTEYDGESRGYIRIAYGTDDPHRWELLTLAEGEEAAAAEDVAIADVNGDGRPDIVAACELAHLIYFQNPGEDVRRTPWRRVIPTVARDRGSYIRVFLADLNGDGQVEAISPNKGAQNPPLDTPDKNPVSIYAIDGAPLDPDAWSELELGRYRIPQNSRPVDLDGDGDLDIVVGARSEAELVIFENLGGEGFNFKAHPVQIDGGRGGGFNLDFADLSGDGRLDVALTVGDDMAWIEQPETFDDVWPLHIIGTIMPDLLVGLVLADINGDERLDVFVGAYSRGPRDHDGDLAPTDRLGRLAWFAQPADGSEPWVRHDVSRRMRGMFDKFVARDLDNDGDMDFVGTRGNSAPYDGVFWLEQVRTEEPHAAFQRARDEDSAEMPLP